MVVTVVEQRTAAGPMVSVVVCNHNHERYVEQAVRSALEQSPPPVEVLVVDDGSTDGSRGLLEALAAQDDRVRVLVQENRGVVHARNRGLQEAIGDWVVQLDADDELLPGFLARTWQAHEEAGDPRLAFVYTDARLIGASTGVLRSRRFSRRALALGNYVYNCCLLRRTAALEVDGYDAAFSRSHEDWDLFLKLVEHGWTGRRVPEPLFAYRRHEGTSRNVNSAADYATLVDLMIQRHPRTYRSWVNRSLVRRTFPGLRALLWLRRQARPALPRAE